VSDGSQPYDLSRARLVPYAHQRVGVDWILTKPAMMLADEMGAGKTKQTIDAIQVMFETEVLDRALIIAPASVRSVWFDPELGELKKHLWETTPASVTQFHAKPRTWHSGPPDARRRLQFLITNYEFIRSKNRLEQLLASTGPKTLLVLDESTAVKNWTALQTKACFMLRKRCGRVLLLNGTPIANNPLDMYAQGKMMADSILNDRPGQSYTLQHFYSKYAVMGGFENRQVVKWLNLDDMQRRFAPYVLRRLKKDCLDLPEKLPPVTYTVALTDPTWKLYKEMRDDMVAWLSDTTAATAQQAMVKGLRLAQLTSGFIGGVSVEAPLLEETPTEAPGWLEELFATEAPAVESTPAPALAGPVAEVGREKLDWLLHWLGDRLVADPNFKVVIWVRFLPELHRAVEAARERFPRVVIEGLYGGQKRLDRENALRALDPRTAPSGPAWLFGTLGTGSLGLNMTAADNMLDLSYDFSLYKYTQSRDRIHRPGQTRPTSYFDVVATGPNGQKTIDHHIVKARREKHDLANWTTAAWVRALREE
jgi:hypothetical protein